MELAENGEVATIIVKDMSRLGRDYLQVGQLTELVFPSLGIRFIAINDNIDSLHGENEFAPFMNIMAEWYARDTSKKIRAVVKAKAERGERIGTRAPYGYKKREDNPKQIVPDEEVAEIVRHMFKLCASGRGPTQIARQLTAEQVLNPTNYYYQQTGVALPSLDTTRPFEWHGRSVVKMLENIAYLGHTLNLRHTSISYKNKKKIERPKSEWLTFENTHEPLISQELWDIAQDVRKHKKRTQKRLDTPGLFSGLVFCADCGGTLTLHRAHSMKEGQVNFKCSTYGRYGKEACSSHYIRESQLKTIILDDLKRVTHYARKKEKLFAEYITSKSSVETKREITKTQREIDAATRRSRELAVLFKKLYEDNALERIPSETYRFLSAEYTSEQGELKERLPELEEKLEQLKNSLTNVERFIDKAKRYTDITELTPELLRLFIQKIVVGEKAEKYSRTAEQKIWIYYRDVGLMDTPMESESQDESLADFDDEDEFEDYLPTKIACAERSA